MNTNNIGFTNEENKVIATDGEVEVTANTVEQATEAILD